MAIRMLMAIIYCLSIIVQKNIAEVISGIIFLHMTKNQFINEDEIISLICNSNNAVSSSNNTNNDDNKTKNTKPTKPTAAKATTANATTAKAKSKAANAKSKAEAATI